MTDPSLSAPVRMRADQLSVGDLVPDKFLPHRFNKGPAEVRFVADDGEAHTFFAFRYPNGQHDSTTVRSDAALEIWPAPAAPGLDYSRTDDGEITQAIGVREPLHTGAMTEGGLVDETHGRPYATFAEQRIAYEAEPTGLIVGDAAEEQMSNAYAAYERDEGEYLVSHGPVKPPYGSPEREAYDRAQGEL